MINPNKTVHFVAYTIIIIAIVYGAFYLFNTSPKETVPVDLQASLETKDITLHIAFYDEVFSSTNINWIPGQTAFSVLKSQTEANNIELSFKDYGGDLGVFIESIDGLPDGNSSDKWWQYWINDEYMTIGVSSYVMSPGDSMVWKFTGSQEEPAQ